jgi:hypothetical protein
MLKNIIVSNKRQNQLKNYLLLLSRILIIVCLSLLFAKPYISNDENNNKKNAIAILIDNSFSMENASKEGQLLSVAKKKAKLIASLYNEDDEFLLMDMDIKGKDEQFISKKDIISNIDNINLSSASPFLSQPINIINDFLKEKKELNKYLFIISDYQKSAFDIENFPKDTLLKTRFIPLIANNINNIYIDTLFLLSPLIEKGENISIRVRINNKTDKKVELLSVKLFVDNKQEAVSSCDIEENGVGNVDLNFTIDRYGPINCRVIIEDYPIIFDDALYFTINVKENIGVLSINNDKENEYISRLFKNQTKIKYDNCSKNNIDYAAFSNYSLIILNELDEISSGLSSQLLKYRENGGDILIIPCSNIDIPSYNSALSQLKLPLYTSLVKKKNKVSKVFSNNPLYDGVFLQKKDNMEKPEVNYYYTISSFTNTIKDDILSFPSNDAFLIVSTMDKSRVYMFSSPLNQEGTSFVKEALFVPTIWNMALFSQSTNELYYYINTNNPIDVSHIPNINRIKLLKVTSLDSSFSIIPSLTKGENMDYILLYNQINKAGNYNITSNDSIVGKISLNYDRKESYLSFYEPSQIKEKIKKYGLKGYDVFSGKEKTIEQFVSKTDRNNILSLILLSLLAFSLALETYFLIKKRG